MPYQINRQIDPRTGTWNDLQPAHQAGPIAIPREGTAPLLAKVLGITSLGFLITAVGVATSPAWATLPGFIAVLALIFAINGARRSANANLALGLFLLLTYFMGWEIGPLHPALHRRLRPGHGLPRRR